MLHYVLPLTFAFGACSSFSSTSERCTQFATSVSKPCKDAQFDKAVGSYSSIRVTVMEKADRDYSALMKHRMKIHVHNEGPGWPRRCQEHKDEDLAELSDIATGYDDLTFRYASMPWVSHDAWIEKIRDDIERAYHRARSTVRDYGCPFPQKKGTFMLAGR